MIPMPVYIEIIDRSSPVSQASLRRLIAQIMKAEGYGRNTLTLILADSGRLRRLNRKYRQIDRVTDVISFAMREGQPHPGATSELGDIYISLPRTRRQARQYRVSFDQELRRLVVHGTLHLLGYDHQKPAQAARMRNKEHLYLNHCKA